MKLRRRLAFLALLALLPFSTGCSKEAWGFKEKAKASGYAGVATGMNERQVVALLGEPTKRAGMRLESTGPLATVLTYVGHNQLINVTLVGGAVVGKQKY